MDQGLWRSLWYPVSLQIQHPCPGTWKSGEKGGSSPRRKLGVRLDFLRMNRKNMVLRCRMNRTAGIL
ncbi:uncharacterized protein Dmul_06990 [Desulfococcus multivorans]|nr:uncharacterized protein Dmul_06990 [Desulfococcus multivorans]